MSHQRYPSLDNTAKEPHSISLKVLRLSCPSLVKQHPTAPPSSLLSSSSSSSQPQQPPPPIPASLSYATKSSTNPSPFLLSPILNLPTSFGSAYVGETFSCTLCANNDLSPGAVSGKAVRDVRVEAEMKTPNGGGGAAAATATGSSSSSAQSQSQKLEVLGAGVRDLDGGETLQGIVSFDLKEEGNHVLAVTVSYYEASETSGRTRTFRKLYQFLCKSSLVVRTKVGPLDAPVAVAVSPRDQQQQQQQRQQQQQQQQRRRWVLEAQLANCGDGVMQLEKVTMNTEAGLRSRSCNWEVGGSGKPVLHPGDVEQVCFLVEEDDGDAAADTAAGMDDVKVTSDGRIVFGALGIGWRGEMGNRGFLSTGKLGTRAVR